MVDRAAAMVRHAGGHDFLTTIFLTSWPYDELAASRDKATAFFQALRAAMDRLEPAAPFPYEGPWEVALIDANEWWMVAVWGVMPDRTGVLGELDTWLKACGVDKQGYTAEEFHNPPSDQELSEVVSRAAWGRVVDRFEGTSESADEQRTEAALTRS